MMIEYVLFNTVLAVFITVKYLDIGPQACICVMGWGENEGVKLFLNLL